MSKQEKKGVSLINILIPVVLVAGIPIVFLFTSDSKDQSQLLYEAQCANCHGTSGEGLRNLYPPLAKADFVEEHPEKIACIIRNGMEGEVVVNGKTYNQPMPGNQQLSADQIANIINYIRRNWGNEAPYTTPQKVQEQLRQENCE